MDYTQLFRSLREAQGLSVEKLARMARVHRNTVINVESGRPVKFRTMGELMRRMGYGPESGEMRALALLWLESVSGIAFSRPETEQSAGKTITRFGAPARQAARELERAVCESGLSVEQIGFLAGAVRNRELLSILEEIDSLVKRLATDQAPERKVAED